MGIHDPIMIEIDGMTCAACVGRAERAIAAVAGVAGAEVNLATRGGKLTLLPDAGPTVPRAVSGALAAAGYPAVPHRIRLDLPGLAPADAAGVEAALMAVPGVLTAHVLPPEGMVVVSSLTAAPDPLIAALQQAGHPAALAAAQARPLDRQRAETDSLRRRSWIAAALTAPVVLLEMGGHLVPALHHWTMATLGQQTSWLLQFVLATMVMIGPGRGFYARGLPALLRLAPDMNALVALGTGAAWGFSTLALLAPSFLPAGAGAVYFESAAVIITLVLLGRWLESRARGQTGDAIRRLVALRPATARVERAGDVVDLPLADIRRGDIIQLRPGERVALDGLVREGTSHVDESMMTGEPMPVAKSRGSALVGGTVNGTGALRMRVTAIGADTMLSRIIAMVEQAQAVRLPVQDMVNRITGWFVPAILAIALLTVVLWVILGPAPILQHALVAGVSVLIIACPCAMGLAVPVSIIVGTGRAAELGVLFRQGAALQTLAGVRIVAIDKTGTLTIGKPDLSGIDPVGMSENDLLALVAGIEALSEHPVARAIVAAARQRNLTIPMAGAVTAVPGLGVSGRTQGRQVAVGNARWMTQEKIDLPALAAIAPGDSALTRVFVAIDGVFAGTLTLSDQPKPTARATVAALRAAGLRVVMISGDAQAAARSMAAQLGIHEVQAEVLPSAKLDQIRALQAQGGPVAYVGDGINDAPALAGADVGIAIGTGTDVAIESADVVLMSGDPAGVATALGISGKTMQNIRQNLIWAFGYNILLVPVAAGALYPVWGIMLTPTLAAGAMAASSLLVLANALRLRSAGRALQRRLNTADSPAP